mmetsp:Transcript_3943/g.6509  ORF Transcript_3943/g.6509 Transcript_3943/m.6509 type:complete len:257 (+) Transcript_3943:669-1439(+)
MMVGVGKEFARLFGCSIGRNGIIHVLILREESILRSTIHTARGGKHKVLDTKLVRQLHQVRSSTNIRVNVHKGILNRWPHTSTSGHVTDPLRAFLLKQLEHEILITDVTTVDSKAFVLGIHLTKTSEVVLLDTNIVVIVHFIHDDNIITSCEEGLGNVGSNKPGTTSNKDLLVSHVWRDGTGTGDTTYTLLRGIIIREGKAGHIRHGCSMSHSGGSVRSRGSNGRFIARRGRVLIEDSQRRHAFSVTEVLHDDMFW